jgi:hypothetical protein
VNTEVRKMKTETVKNILDNFEDSVKLCNEPCSPEIYQTRAEAMLVSERDAMDALEGMTGPQEEIDALEWRFSYVESLYEDTINKAREETGHEDR